MRPKKLVLLATLNGGMALARHMQFSVWGFEVDLIGEKPFIPRPKEPSLLMTEGPADVPLVAQMRSRWPLVPMLCLVRKPSSFEGASLQQAGATLVADDNDLGQAWLKERMRQMCARRRGPKTLVKPHLFGVPLEMAMSDRDSAVVL